MTCEETPCAKCTVHCKHPVCSVECQGDTDCEEENPALCGNPPSCATVCEPADCSTTCVAPEPKCSPVCEEAQCEWVSAAPACCPAAPSSTCKTAPLSTLSLGTKGVDKLAWKWRRGEATSDGELGNPADSTLYALCLYANGSLVRELNAIPGELWGLAAHGVSYDDPEGNFDGIKKMSVKSGVDGKARANVKGQNTEGTLDLPALPLALPVVAQLYNNDEGVCWTSSFPEARKNTETGFQAKQP